MHIEKIHKNKYFAFVSFFLLLCLFSCTKSISLPSFENEGFLSAGIWYTVSMQGQKQEIPLLVQAEWKKNKQTSVNTSKSEANIAFIFLHGTLFAQCTLTDDILKCRTQSNIPQAQLMAEEMAKLTAKAITSMQAQQRTSQIKFTHNVNKKNFANAEFNQIEKDKEIKLIVKDFQANK